MLVFLPKMMAAKDAIESLDIHPHAKASIWEAIKTSDKNKLHDIMLDVVGEELQGSNGDRFMWKVSFVPFSFH